MTFADTSALYAVLSSNDRRHALARSAWTEYLRGRRRYVTTSYVVHETVALLQARIGLAAVATWRNEIEPILDVVWVDGALHDRALGALVAAARRDVSLTDWVSFEVMRKLRLRTAFTLDHHFREQGFEVTPT